MHLKQEKGFTLVELLASIVLITIILTTFMHVFAQAIIFANKNEEKLTVANDAREVLSLIQENNDVINLLINENILSSSYVIEDDIIDDSSTIKRLIDPDDKFTLTGENITLKLEDGPNNMLEVKVDVKSPNSSTISTTYGYISKKSVTGPPPSSDESDGSSTGDVAEDSTETSLTQIDLADFPVSETDGIFYLRTGSLSDVFSKNGDELKIKNSRATSNGDTIFKEIESTSNEYIITGNIKFISPSDVGGFGILVDVTFDDLTNNKQALDNGYMIKFSTGKVELLKRVDGVSLSPSMQTKNSSIQLEEISKIQVTVQNSMVNSRKYTVTLFNSTGLQNTIEFNQISFNNSNQHRYLGITLWGNPGNNGDSHMNELRVSPKEE